MMSAPLCKCNSFKPASFLLYHIYLSDTTDILGLIRRPPGSSYPGGDGIASASVASHNSVHCAGRVAGIHAVLHKNTFMPVREYTACILPDLKERSYKAW